MLLSEPNMGEQGWRHSWSPGWLEEPGWSTFIFFTCSCSPCEPWEPLWCGNFFRLIRLLVNSPHLPSLPRDLKDTWLYKKTTVLRSEGPICSGGVNTGPLNPSQWSGSHSFVWRSHKLHTCSIGAKYFPLFTNNLSFWDLHLVFEKYNWFAISSTWNSAFAQTLEIEE